LKKDWLTTIKRYHVWLYIIKYNLMGHANNQTTTHCTNLTSLDKTVLCLTQTWGNTINQTHTLSYSTVSIHFYCLVQIHVSHHHGNLCPAGTHVHTCSLLFLFSIPYPYPYSPQRSMHAGKHCAGSWRGRSKSTHR
jgi:hypothetical protein